jgi:calcium-dependent protein kinase
MNTKEEDVTFGKHNFVNYRTELITTFYSLQDVIGTGSTSTVRKGVHRTTNLARAIKIMRKRDYDEKLLFNEMNILIKLNHPNIMQVYEIYDDEKNFYIVQELCQGGTFLEYVSSIDNFSESDAVTIMKQILSVVAYLHKCNVTHRYRGYY